MIKLGLSIDDEKIEEELPNLEQDTPNAGESTSNKMEEVDWPTHSKWFISLVSISPFLLIVIFNIANHNLAI